MMGPYLIFDKSFLESISLNESVWLDSFFASNITPIFFVETLADLEKASKKGNTSRNYGEIVAEIANKTPEMSSVPSIHHMSLLIPELLGRPVEMEHHRPIVTGGQYLSSPTGDITVNFDQFPEASAFMRWKQRKFFEIEGNIAKEWRKALSQPNYEKAIASIKEVLPDETKLSTMEEIKSTADELVKRSFKSLIYVALELLDIPLKHHKKIVERWRTEGWVSFEDFAPYAAHVLKVNIFFYLCHYKSFLGRITDRVDISYLYYLPFCHVFVSNDNLHARVVPFFINEDQTFIRGNELKTELQKLNDHFVKLPEEVKKLGTFVFASYPPLNVSPLIETFYDKYMNPNWRKNSEHQLDDYKKLRESPTKDLKHLKNLKESSTPYIGPPLSSDETKGMSLKRYVRAKKGDWLLLPEDIIKKSA